MNTLQEFDFLRSVGGKPVAGDLRSSAKTADEVAEWNFGLLQDFGPPGLCHTPQTKARQEALQITTPRFQLRGQLATDPKKVILTDVFKQPIVKAALGKYLQKIGGRSEVYPGNKQLTGACVGVGSGDDMTIAAAVEMAWKGDGELPIIFWWPYTYGRGRLLGGMRTPGEGSFSESQAEACLEGTLRADLDSLPAFADNGDGLVIPSSMEIQWSDGDSSTVLPWMEQAKVHRFRTSAVIRSFDDARACIRDAKMPFMFCGNWGGLMQCPTQGNPPCLLNRKSGSWSHNQTAIAWWDHPTLGELLGIKNQWGNTVHGVDPAGLPPGAYWINRSDAEYQIRQGSCISITAFDGHQALDLPFDWIA